MPIVVTCPSCPTKLSAPDNAAGKQIRCPKCGAMATVPALIPAEEMPIVDAAVVSAKPKSKAIQAEIDEDEDDRPQKSTHADRDEDEPERPRKKKTKRYAERPRRPRKSGSGVVIALIIVGVLSLLVIVGGAVYYLAPPGVGTPGKNTPFARKAPPPPGWQLYSYPEDGFKAYMPEPPIHGLVPSSKLVFPGKGFGKFGDDEVQEMESVSTYSSANVHGPVSVNVQAFRFRSRVPASMHARIRGYGDGEKRSIQWLGLSAEERVVRASAIRTICTDRSVIDISIAGPGCQASPAEVNGFFDNFELTR